MGLAFIPLYINYLGIEAYGLIGLFALLQAWLSLLDIGITPTLGREMARFTGGSHTTESIRDLLRSIELIAIGIAILIVVGVALSANWLSTAWLKADTLSNDVMTQALVVMGLVAAIRFVEGVYRSAIVGLQRQVLFNVINSLMATFRAVGAVGVLVWISASIEAFFIWQGAISIATLAILAATTYASLPAAKRTAHFSIDALRGVWRFAAGMLGITLLSLLLMQVDKVLLSKLLTLTDFGYYTLAATAASIIFVLISPITQALHPKLCELQALNDQPKLLETYHKGAQLVSVIAGSAAVVMILFSETLLRLWTQDPVLAARTAPLLSLLILGNLLNGLMWIPYHTQLAHGWTSLAVRTNIVAVALIIPAILWATPRFGAEGAAVIWTILNLAYVTCGAHFMYRKLLRAEKFKWYTEDLAVPIGSALLVGILFKSITPETSDAASQLLIIISTTVVACCTSLLSANHVREQAVKITLTWRKSLPSGSNKKP